MGEMREGGSEREGGGIGQKAMEFGLAGEEFKGYRS